MRKVYLILLVLLVNCGEQNAMERYFSNCVNDYLKNRTKDKNRAISECEYQVKVFPNKFKYLKGKIFSQ